MLSAINVDRQATGNSSVNRRRIPLRGEDGAITARVRRMTRTTVGLCA